MNIVEAFNKMIQNPELKVKLGERKFCVIDGDLYSKFNTKPYRYVSVAESKFSCEEVMSSEWEVTE